MSPNASRRAFLRLCLLAPVPVVLAACSGGQAAQPPAAASAVPSMPAPTVPTVATVPPVPSPAAAAPAPANATAPAAAPVAAVPTLVPTPACADDDEPTAAQTEGPFFTPNSPERALLVEPGMAGVRLALSGHILTTACQPVAGALIDIWQADDAGVYDNQGFRLRGHQFTDAQGFYRFETILPGLYPGRTRHIHVKVQAANGPVLTTQLYFPDEPANRRDRFYDSALEVALSDATDGKAGSFSFVLA